MTSYRIPLYIMMALAIGVLLGGRLQDDHKIFVEQPAPSAEVDPLHEILGYVEHHYVDEVDLQRITASAIKVVMDSLDRHSTYLSAKEVQKYKMKMSGDYVGLGIHFTMITDTPVVTHVYSGSPAEAAGLEVGDQFLRTGGAVLVGDTMDYTSVSEHLKGGRGETLSLEVGRCNDIRNIDIIRGRVHTASVSQPIRLDDGIHFISIHHFNQHTSTEFLDALEPIQESGELKDLVIDLRGNPGGYLDEAIKLLNQFITKKGQLLLYTEGHSSERKEYTAKGKAYLEVDDVVVLLDHNSASASEIVAGAIQDLDRGLVIGRRSYGKGLVQEQYPLSSGGALKLTVARYYTPSGRLIQSAPSLLAEQDAYPDPWDARWASGEFCHPLALPLTDSVSYCSVYGHDRFGGRGIVPDIFVPLDSLEQKWMSNDTLWQAIESKAFGIYRSGLACTGQKAEDAHDVHTASALEVAHAEWIERTSEGHDESLAMQLPVILEALVARYQHGKHAWLESMLQVDADVKAAVSHLRRMSGLEAKPQDVFAEQD